MGLTFDDELSDSGNGSYAHGINGDPANIYGFGTWTDGPVAVSYLAEHLGVPLTDYAFGACCGGGSFGATINNTYNAAAQDDGQPAPSSSAPTPVWEGEPKNALFARNIPDRIRYNAEHLIELEAPYVFVANIYSKHKTPVMTTFLCPDGSCVDTWGGIIQSTNYAIKAALKSLRYASKLIYYDVFGFMVGVMEKKNS
ncbi:hypothetical protein B0A55_10997 [Friedmanniomyces simplex]|uniref:Uncharacterized protein n=1 Tax=Friedmanniomyces simplex TaxID=329884 RepID=A0A4U0W630_9PEZI|nr:hypothetical protein B0A55_10997 [Friedmanniomyces simplex]